MLFTALAALLAFAALGQSGFTVREEAVKGGAERAELVSVRRRR